MSSGEPDAIGAAMQASAHASPKQLNREAVSLGLILLVTLTVAALERRGIVPWAGYPSSLVLLTLSGWHKWRFGVTVRFFPPHRERSALPWVLSMACVALLAVAAWMPLQPWSPASPSPLYSLHLLLLVPLSEELYFRGLLLDHLRRGFTSVQAVLLCTLLFASLHTPLTAALVAGILSVVACGLVLKMRSLACALQVHVAWNSLVEIGGIGDPSSRWLLAIIASGIVVMLATIRSKYQQRLPDGAST
jgi:membrane protease YdiL (CAAX protease family)